MATLDRCCIANVPREQAAFLQEYCAEALKKPDLGECVEQLAAFAKRANAEHIEHTIQAAVWFQLHTF